jgi:hypothetical protein
VHLTTRKLFKQALCLLGAIFIIAMLIFFNVNRASIENALVTLDLVPKPEKLTELYFNNNTNLPDAATKNRTIHFTFVIHNLETTDYQYLYAVSVNARGTRHIVDRGKVFVKNNQYYIKYEQFKLMHSSGSQEVVVELTNKQQSIDFWTGK